MYNKMLSNTGLLGAPFGFPLGRNQQRRRQLQRLGHLDEILKMYCALKPIQSEQHLPAPRPCPAARNLFSTFDGETSPTAVCISSSSRCANNATRRTPPNGKKPSYRYMTDSPRNVMSKDEHYWHPEGNLLDSPGGDAESKNDENLASVCHPHLVDSPNSIYSASISAAGNDDDVNEKAGFRRAKRALDIAFETLRRNEAEEQRMDEFQNEADEWILKYEKRMKQITLETDPDVVESLRDETYAAITKAVELQRVHCREIGALHEETKEHERAKRERIMPNSETDLEEAEEDAC